MSTKSAKNDKSVQKWPASAIIEKPVKSLIPYARNARTHSPEQIKQLMASIKEWGWTIPVLIDETDMIIAGHGRIMAAEQMGIDEVPCMVATGWSDAQKKAYVIADNKLALNAGWNDEMLNLEFQDLKVAGFDLKLTGFDIKELAALEPTRDATDADDEVPEEREDTVSQPGEMFELGKHILMCGDSTDAEQLARLMGGKQAVMCFTSPPYNGNVRMGTFVKRDKQGGMYKGGGFEDNEDSEKYIEFAKKVLDNMFMFCSDFILWNVNYNTNEKTGYIKQIIPYLDRLIEQIAWVKTSIIPYVGTMRREWEPIYLFSCNGKTPNFEIVTSNVWKISNANCNISGHAGCFPVDLVKKGIEYFSKHDDIILDPFCGSGTSIIASAMTGRICRAMEISPKYCDVIRRRWTKWARENNQEVGSGGLD